jgi:ribonuclease P/MRP protein subunit RPP1
MKDINLSPCKDSIYLKKINSKTGISVGETDGYLIDADEREARRIVDSLKGKSKIIGILGRDDAFNRRVIETLKINYLVSPERETKTDTLKQRDSGMNHVIAKEAVRKNIIIVINLSEIYELNKEEKAIRLSKIIQNIKICRRAKCPVKIANFSTDRKDLVNEIGRKSLGISLGMSTGQAKESVEF